MKKIDYGNKIVQLARALGLSPHAFGEKINIPNPTMQSYINKGVEPKLDFLRKLMDAVPNLNLKWFFFDEGPIFNEDIEKITMDLVKKENELYRKLEREREKNTELQELLDIYMKEKSKLKEKEKEPA